MKRVTGLYVCVICFEILSDRSMEPSLLERYGSIRHPVLENKHEGYLKKLTGMKGT